MYDLIIIGGGPAACAAAVYAARKQLKTAIVAGEFGGQSTVSEDIQNWIGTPHIAGADLAKSLKAHVLEYKGDVVTVMEGVLVTGVSGSAGSFTVSLDKGEALQAHDRVVAQMLWLGNAMRHATQRFLFVRAERGEQAGPDDHGDHGTDREEQADEECRTDRLRQLPGVCR